MVFKIFVFVHSWQLLYNLVKSNHFSKWILSEDMKLTYVLLGPNHSSYKERLQSEILEKLETISICIEDAVPGNVSAIPNAVAYGGWIAICKAGLVDAKDKVLLLEYDTIVKASFADSWISDNEAECVFFSSIQKDDKRFLSIHPSLGSEVRAMCANTFSKDGIFDNKLYQTCIQDRKWFPNGAVPMVSNSCMYGSTLLEIVPYLEMGITKAKEKRILGHTLERFLVFILYFLKRSVLIRNDSKELQHLQKYSHGQYLK